MGRSTVHYADNPTNTILKRLHNKLRPAGTPVQRVEYIIELLLLRIFEVKLKQDPDFVTLRKLFDVPNDHLLFSSLYSVANELLLSALNEQFFPFYSNILGHARKVYTGNLSQKVQDQLVLIEEVFANSNFTNNVKSGNLQEIISLIAELDEERLLKTDLLGDAIESALSETGGTKDIGLHRTPDHIRQFMVGLVQPTFNDTSFDPACGTAGFLFDNFGYVMESVSNEGHWPGPKAHPQLQAYFKRHFASKISGMPSQEKAITFYRSGLFGIEYLGMIRKMAAINLYIRGLNPQNIEQGDSLAMFDPVKDRNSKTIVLANPPFGAQRDQEAYPNIWEEFPRESETTILFIKLMLDALEPGGRCAVIVSEGFMTWDQGSARALRKLLLEAANLKAIISLPQGVFISKGGVGPKTSILFFEKGAPTKEVWFYKVTNDGYTMGTNRKPIEGCQLVEALRLYDEYVRNGETPPETKHSFSIPAEWIERLDPRIKQRIIEETSTEMKEKEAVDRDKLTKKFQKQLENGDTDKADYNGKLREHEELWNSKTQNEIAKRIEREHLYSFNLQHYRSGLSLQQLEEWNASFNGKPRTNGQSLDERYQALISGGLAKALNGIALFDPQNAVEFDIVRQFITGFSFEDLQKHPELAHLRKIIESGAKYPIVKLKEYLVRNTDKISPSDFPDTRFRVLGVSNTKGIFLNETLEGSEIKQSYFRVQPMQLCYNPYRVNVGSIGLCEFDYDNQIISGAYEIFGTVESDLHPKYFMALLKAPQFLAYVDEKAHGGVRMNFKYEYLEEWEIPLPPMETQELIVAENDRQGKIISGAELVLKNWQIEKGMFSGNEIALSEIADIGTGSTPSRSNGDYFGGSINWVLTTEVDECEIHTTAETLTDKAIKDYGLKIYPSGTILVAMYGQGKTRGKAALLKCNAAITQNCAAIMIHRDDVIPKYIYYYLRSMYEVIRGQEYSGAGVPHLNLKIIGNIRVPIPDKEIQLAVVAEVDRMLFVADNLRTVIAETEKNIRQIMSQTWKN